MNITIDWAYFLGIMGGLIGTAWYSSGRFARIETDMTWLKKETSSIKKSISELKLVNDNKNSDAFAAHSPVSLTQKGSSMLSESGMKDFVDSSIETLSSLCKPCETKNPYQIQQYVFDLFDSYKFPDKEFDLFQRFAFEKGLSIEIIRRVGAIYFRDIYLDRLGHKRSDIDRHDPNGKSKNV